MWIRLEDSRVFQTYSEIRLGYPNTSFPVEITPENIASIGLVEVERTDPPQGDVVTRYFEPNSNVERWEVRSFTEEELSTIRASMKVSMRQARLALLKRGLLASIPTLISSLPEEDKALFEIEWEYSTNVERTSPWVSMLGQALGLDALGLDILFKEASLL